MRSSGYYRRRQLVRDLVGLAVILAVVAVLVVVVLGW